MNNISDIDIVIPWVDGSDPAWQAEFRKYCTTDGTENTSVIRYRDWETMRYWFRSVEEFTPWVRKIHFVTWGHLPSWLDTANPKLHIVRHTDYIPSEYLPTFCSRPIELNVHRIEGLSDKFIWMNDDTFFGRKLKAERFFKNGLPRDMARLSIISHSSISHNILNMSELINRYYKLGDVIRAHPQKWFAPCYGLRNIVKTLVLSQWGFIPALMDTHMPQPYLKSSFERVWARDGERLDSSCRHRTRQNSDVNEWLMRYEQLLSGEFEPVSVSDTKLYTLGDESIDSIADDIRRGRYALYCMNDSTSIRDFETVKHKLIAAYQSLLPNKSSYEL